MFAQRAIIAVTLGPLALYLVYLGEWYYFIPLVAVLLLATVEFVQMTRLMGWHTSHWVLLPLVLALLVAAQFATWEVNGLVMLLALLIVLAYVLWIYERNESQTAPADWMAMIGALVLFGWLGGHFFRLRGIENMAWQWTVLVLAATWITDSAAYVVGRFMAGKVLGRHQLSPRLSPNKTVEGYMGGVILGTSLTVGLAYLLQLPLQTALVVGLVISIFSTLGDLGISLLKREADVKDSGTIFRGHGGALDRVDSLLWSVALAFYLVTFMS